MHLISRVSEASRDNLCVSGDAAELRWIFACEDVPGLKTQVCSSLLPREKDLPMICKGIRLSAQQFCVQVELFKQRFRLVPTGA